ncbi:MAG TPA: hypothetical protein VM864_05310 [Pyrinomonadaceae bacterium]|nr:hypothetical protein [Pyrinomonadaceae bacterium]
MGKKGEPKVRVVRSIFCAALAACACLGAARAQESQPQQPADERGVRESRAALADAATAYDIAGRVALAARLRTTQLAGAADAPVRNVLIVVENRSGLFYNYASGWATFYDGAGVRCGEGLWKVEAFAPGESAEVDTPGLRLTCAPATWRVTALNLLTRSTDVAKPGEPAPTAGAATALPPTTPAQAAAGAGAEAPMRLEINVNGKTLPLQLDNPLDVVVGKERVLIVVRRAP